MKTELEKLEQTLLKRSQDLRNGLLEEAVTLGDILKLINILVEDIDDKEAS